MALDRDLFSGLGALAPPSFVEELPFADIRDEILATLLQQLPDWTESPDDPLYKAAENAAYREFVLRQSFNAGYRAGLLAYAAGADLDQLAALLGVERQDDEDDDGLRSRIPIALRACRSALRLLMTRSRGRLALGWARRKSPMRSAALAST